MDEPGQEIALNQEPSASVRALLNFWPRSGPDINTAPPRDFDMRHATDYAPSGTEPVERNVTNARDVAGLDLHSCGFELVHRPTAIADFLNNEDVMSVYYDECRALARELTGASVTFTYDHLVREPGRQISGGGTDRSSRITGAEAGGGYVELVHMDYTDNTTWEAYLDLHGERPPENPERVYALNFWRALSSTAEANPLAVCDARTIAREDLFETVVYGYGADNYSWHDIGIETYNVKSSPRQRWYYYSDMSPDEVLVLKSYDSAGVVGRACAHSAFVNPAAGVDAPARRSIELRVLCFVV
jgi:hypothetical protein